MLHLSNKLDSIKAARDLPRPLFRPGRGRPLRLCGPAGQDDEEGPLPGGGRGPRRCRGEVKEDRGDGRGRGGQLFFLKKSVIFSEVFFFAFLLVLTENSMIFYSWCLCRVVHRLANKVDAFSLLALFFMNHGRISQKIHFYISTFLHQCNYVSFVQFAPG